jgi:hypothetical protein
MMCISLVLHSSVYTPYTVVNKITTIRQMRSRRSGRALQFACRPGNKMKETAYLQEKCTGQEVDG